MSDKSPSGNIIHVNRRYFEYNQKPWFPIMGEMHFSRCESQFWEESILKFKACGFDVIATYVFWNHHEEIVNVQYLW